MDHCRVALVWVAVVFHHRFVFAYGQHRDVDEMAGDSARRSQPLYPDDFPGVFFGELHATFGVGSHGETGFFSVVADQSAISHFVATGGFGRFCQRGQRAGGHGLRGKTDVAGALGSANNRVPYFMRGGNFHSLLADVPAFQRGVLDGSFAGDCLGVLQFVQHRAVAGRRVSRFFQGVLPVCASHAVGGKRSCQVVDTTPGIAPGNVIAGGHDRGLLRRF